MTSTYQVTGMTCGGCEAKVKASLLSVPGISSAIVSKESATAILNMSEPVAINTLQEALGTNGKYHISPAMQEEITEENRSWLQTYKPILLIFGYILLITGLIQFSNKAFDLMQWMRHFMAGFFLVFSFFKLLNLKGFAESYAMYDVLAKRIPAWGYVYAFIELALGICFMMNFDPLATNAITLAVMGISISGVLQSVLNKRKIQCACLGSVFNLPMSTVTIIEDALMIGMSIWSLILMSS